MERTIKAKIVYYDGSYALGGKKNYMWTGLLVDYRTSNEVALWMASCGDKDKEKKMKVKEVEVTIKS